jgi:L-rhamnose isomerase|tara:strand:+ start:224 stop:1507 length:1284 start_codon:yes stop_codon:yes gene_type:complete
MIFIYNPLIQFMSKEFDIAKEKYACIGVDVENVLDKLGKTPISMHCWQGDDVRGFETGAEDLGDGLAVTGNYPGRANTIEELKQDLEKAISLIPGDHRLNLHAIYGDFGGKFVDRDQIDWKHFQGWMDWCKSQKMGMDFNPSCFSHANAKSGLTLSSPDEGIRNFWIEHCKASRRIAAKAGEQLGSPCVTNIWIPDGMKDIPADRRAFRNRLKDSLDDILTEEFSSEHLQDAVECKLFGIGSESFVVGSHEFYMGYAIHKQMTLCLDAGHFHPTEGIADKISSVIDYIPRLLLHVSRGVRWDSDHVVIQDDATKSIFEELVRSNALDKTSIGLDFFDASINRIAAWVIGTTAAQKCLLAALLQPSNELSKFELEGDYTSRLALFEECKLLPVGEVWNEFCLRKNVPQGMDWLKEVKEYEKTVLSGRS